MKCYMGLMKKLCDSCQYYADQFGFCSMFCIGVSQNLVDDCTEYNPKREIG